MQPETTHRRVYHPFFTISPAPIDRRAAAFDPQSIRQWRDAVGVSEESLGLAAQLDCIAGAEAQQNGLRYRGFVKTQTLE